VAVVMTPERLKKLHRGEGCLLVEEMAEGWHYCQDFDQELTTGEELDSEGRCAWCGFDRRKVRPVESK
jgi:hypothetical protein